MDAEIVDVAGDDDAPATPADPTKPGAVTPPPVAGPASPAGPADANVAAKEAATAPGEGQATETDAVAAAIEADLAALQGERDQFRELLQRTMADFDNYRKRQQSQLADEVDRSTGKLVEQLLPTLDACEAGYAHGVEGVEQVWSLLLGTLQKQGLEAMDLQGKPFDPSEAEAVLHEPAEDDQDGPVVTEVLRTGYRWKGRTLRAAMVKVKG